MHTIQIKPLSVNEAWQGQRYKTPKYRAYEAATLLILPKITIPEAPYSISIELGFSNKLSDLDNPIKMILDILQKKYLINDRDIYQLVITKKIVSKSQEYFKFNLETLK